MVLHHFLKGNYLKISKSRLGLVLLLLFFIITSIVFFIISLRKPVQSDSAYADGEPIIPVYPNAQLLESTKSPREKVYYETTWETKDSISSVSSWYITEMKENGWLIEYVPKNLQSDIQEMQFSVENYFLSLSLIKNSNATIKIVAQFSSNARTDKMSEAKKSGEPPEDR